MTTAAVTSRRPLVVHPEAEYVDAALHALAVGNAERRLGRALTSGEKRIDLVRLDRDLRAGKARLLGAIEAEQRRAARRFAREAVAGRAARMRLTVSPQIRSALRALYESGRNSARGELRRAGLDPDNLPRRMAARTVPVKLAVIEERIGSRLDVLGTDLEHRLAIAVDLSSVTQREIMDAVARLPGVRSIAADFTSPPTFAGLGSVWDEADAAGVTTQWTYSAVMDDGTCDVCASMDGETYDSWDAIQDVLPDGGPNPDCDGGDRCRCRAVPEFGDTTDSGSSGGGGTPTIGPDEAPPLPDQSQILDSLPIAERVPASEAAPVSPGPHLVGEPTPEFVPEPHPHFARERIDDREFRADRWARDRGMTGDQLIAEMNDRIGELVTNAEPRVRVGYDVFNKILDDGRFKSQFETDTSGGLLDQNFRAAAENELFGYDHDLLPSQRPIYAYLSGARESGWLDQYGSIQVVLRDDVKRRATFTLDDSLTKNSIPQPIYGNDPSLAYAWVMEPPGDIASAPMDELAGAYPEMQVHDGLSVSDIAEVVIPHWEPSPYWQEALRRGHVLRDALDEQVRIAGVRPPSMEEAIRLADEQIAEAERMLTNPYDALIARLEALGIRVRRVQSLTETQP